MLFQSACANETRFSERQRHRVCNKLLGGQSQNTIELLHFQSRQAYGITSGFATARCCGKAAHQLFLFGRGYSFLLFGRRCVRRLLAHRQAQRTLHVILDAK